jgi:hypothetical protein
VRATARSVAASGTPVAFATRPATSPRFSASDVARPNNFFLAHRGFAAAQAPVLQAALDALDLRR